MSSETAETLDPSTQIKNPNVNACFVTSVNREIKQVPNVENIIEEEEEEEEEEVKKVESVQEVELDRPKPKFVLESVVLENEPILNNERVVNLPEPSYNENEVQEIKVEEGYATRQMDEFFRQTIAAIKEELTKKLESKTDKTQHHKHRHRNDDDDYDSESPYFDHDYDMDEENMSDMDTTQKSECEMSFNRCNNRLVLFQNLLALNNKKASRHDKINSWLVLFGCFMNQFLVDGFCYNYVNFMGPISNEFGVQSKLLSSMPGVFLISFLLLMSPMSLFVCKRYGIRRASLIGSLISAISVLISSFFIDNFVIFTVFYGVFTGVGLSLVYVSTIIATSKWFVKKRLFASSINVLGACLGTVVYPLLTELILQRYNLSKTLFIVSSVQLNLLVASMLLFDHKNQFLASNKPRNQLQNKTSDKTILKMRKHRDSETESQISTLTNPNLTLKQYWRKFVQTRKTNSNNKKNLFHLIAEEKRKTRTLSKTSLEDGFVITTSNNLLAPNDDTNVIVTRQAKFQQKPRLITRIANSLRSLTHSSSPKTSIEPVIPLMSVFDGPLTDNTEHVDHTDSDSDEDNPTNLFNANMPKINSKNSRYLSYRNSLTNSVRGSLMECSVPEEDREEEVNSGCDGTCSVDDDDLCTRKSIQRQSKRRSNFTRPRPLQNGTSQTNEIYKNGLSNIQENSVGYSMPTICNLRRFISTIETASFLNVPLNLEPIEYNLRNCLIKKCSDTYRRHQFGAYGASRQENSTLFLDYLAYIINVHLLTNLLLIILNFSFLLNTAGYSIVLFFVSDYGLKYKLSKLQSIYVLCLIGLTCGLGRIVSTISYKVNESNSKSRIFAYVLTLFLNSGCLFVSTVLCDTLFSFSMFAISFGIVLGFNLNLRTLFLYDVVGLEWSDDSVFFYGLFTQAIGICIGVPLAGFVFDYFNDVLYVIYLAGSCFLISGFILLPGRELRTYCKNSIKSLNRFYLQRKNFGN